MTKYIGFLSVLFVLSSTAGAATYVPVDAERAPAEPLKAAKQVAPSNLVVKGLGLITKSVEVKGLKADGTPPRYAECTVPPTVADIGGNFEASNYVMTRTAAVSLGILAGVGNVESDSSASQLVGVFEFSRSKECLASDGKTGVVYGQSIRTVTSFESLDSKANITFPMVAATATVSGKSSSLKVKNFGFNDPLMAVKANELSSMQLSVENFEKFRTLYAELTALAAADTTVKQVQKLGIIPAVDEDDLINTLPTAFAIQQIKDGRSCEEARGRLKDGSESGAKVLVSTYLAITSNCSNAKPSAEAAGRAKDYLQGMKVSR